jgi:hypothetical protein
MEVANIQTYWLPLIVSPEIKAEVARMIDRINNPQDLEDGLLCVRIEECQRQAMQRIINDMHRELDAALLLHHMGSRS